MRAFATRVTLALLSTWPAVSATAQDDGTVSLVVQREGREIGRESFTLRESRAKGQPGTALISNVRYPSVGPTLRLSTTLERTPDLALASFQMEVDSGGAGTIILAAGKGTRLILRTLAKGSEAGRELPGGPDIVLLDDAVFALYAQVADLATAAGKSLTAVFPRTGRRSSFTAQRESTADGVRVALTGGLTGTLTADGKGRLIRLDLPAAQIVVKRAPE